MKLSRTFPELALVVVVAAAVLIPGIWSYTLVDPWETHYGEVGRMMRENHDWVHTDWPQNDEGFRSKPVLTFWMMAAGMASAGVAADGGYSGEMVASARTMLGIRLPFVLASLGGLVLVWFMLARLVSRRLAWLALLVVGTTPFVCLVSRQAIPDTPLLACIMGAIALFVLANEDGDRPASMSARAGVFGTIGVIIVVQALYYAGYLATHPILAPVRFSPQILPIAMLLALLVLWRDGLVIICMPLLAIGGIYVELRGLPRRDRLVGESAWRYGLDVIVGSWARYSPIQFLPFLVEPVVTMRQVYLLWCYVLVAISILAKGPPGLAVIGATIALHTLATWRWPAFEIWRGLVTIVAIALPWHVAMYYADGPRFVDEYWGLHILSRGTVGIDNSIGTFDYYVTQLGHGMWIWAALVPVALATALLRRADRVRFTIALWALASFAFFALVKTKFHHYILPVVPALGILVAFYLDDLLAKRERMRTAWIVVGVAIVLLIGRDLCFEPERWIEMFCFMYTRPWPVAEPYAIDPSDAIIALSIVGSLGVIGLRWRRGVFAVCGVAIAIALWALHGYMPVAAKHWGMRETIETYYRERSIYGAEVTYFGARQVAGEWDRHDDRYRFDTYIPDDLQVGQPMTLHVVINSADNELAFESEYTLAGRVTQIFDHAIEITFFENEIHRLDGVIKRGRSFDAARAKRTPVRVVDADRLLAWQLYWRGENFWTADEIWGWPNDMKTAFMNIDNKEIGKYLSDPKRAPLGRRYFVVTEAGRINNIKPVIPTDRGKTSYEVLDTSSNKFSLGAFFL